MYYSRHIDNELDKWRTSKMRKPLLLRGARQVGKSSAVRQLGKKFKYYIELNLEQRNDLLSIFGDNLDVKWICSQISVYFSTPIIPGETLLFIDEIQCSQRAIASLRFFYEQMPDLHVVAAGSLLEFTLNELPSFGVGRIHSLYMYPFSFDEFLIADDKLALHDFKRNNGDSSQPLPAPMHAELVKQLRIFYIVGGMPSAVVSWCETHDFRQCADVHSDLISTYKDDFKKYKSRISPIVLSNTLQSIALQSGSKFIYSQVNEVDNRQVKEALDLLCLAGLTYCATHSASNGVPLGAEVNGKFRKFLFMDTGLMQTMLHTNIADILSSNDIEFVNKGAMSEVFAGLEIIKYSHCNMPAELFYWQNIDNKGQSEVDYVVEIDGKIRPVEVKASTSGSMQSMYLFMEKKKIDYGIRTSLEPFSQYDKVKVYPLYALSSIIKG